MKKKRLHALSGQVASELEKNTQFQKYHNQRAGHGFAAEDANALHETLQGKHVEKVGLSNAENGPDRITDGIAIQTKYYNTPQRTVNSSFGENGFRYTGQQLEVPADQYEQAVELFRDKIRVGAVRDSSGQIITDERQAEEIVKRGSVTYEQACNIAKAGNIDSLCFDAKNQIVSTGCICGISFVISFANYMWSGQKTKEALNYAFNDALAYGTTSFIVGIAASQLMRTKMAAGLTGTMRYGVKFLAKHSLGKVGINKIASASLGKPVQGIAAINHMSKLLRSTVVTGVIAVGVTSAPDFYRAAFARSISWAQFTKNLAISASSVAGGVGGWAAGAAAGAAVGSLVPFVGTAIGAVAGGIAGAIGGSLGASTVAQALADSLCEDDSVEMIELVKAEIVSLAADFFLSEKEIEILPHKLEDKISATFLRDVYGSGSENSTRSKYIRSKIRYVFEDIAQSRPAIIMPTDMVLHKKINRIVWIAGLHPLDPRLKILQLLAFTKRTCGNLVESYLQKDKNARLKMMGWGTAIVIGAWMSVSLLYSAFPFFTLFVACSALTITYVKDGVRHRIQ